MLAFDDSDQPELSQAPRERGRVHQNQDIRGIVVFGFGSRYETEVIGKGHTSGQDLLEPKNPLLRIKCVFVVAPFWRFDDHPNDRIVSWSMDASRDGSARALRDPERLLIQVSARFEQISQQTNHEKKADTKAILSSDASSDDYALDTQIQVSYDSRMSGDDVKTLQAQLANAREKAKSLAAIAEKSGPDERPKWREQADFWLQRVREIKQEIAAKHGERRT